MVSEESGAELIPNEAEVDAALADVNTDSQTLESTGDEPRGGLNVSGSNTQSQPSTTSKELDKRNRPVLVNDVSVRPEKKVVTKADEE